MESRAAHTHPKNTQVPPPGPLRVLLSPIVLYALAPTTNPMTAPTKNLAKSLAGLPSFASISTNPQGVSVVPVTSPIIATAVDPAVTHSSIAPAPNSMPQAPNQQPQAIAAKNKVEQRQQKQRPTVSTPLDVDKLALELVNHQIDLLLIT